MAALVIYIWVLNISGSAPQGPDQLFWLNVLYLELNWFFSILQNPSILFLNNAN